MVEMPRKPATSLWDRWWVRFPAYLIATPLIISVVDIIIAAVLTVLSEGHLGDASEIVPSLDFLSLWAGGQMVPLLLPMVLTEFGNRRRGAAVPPALCALFVAIFAAGLMVAIVAATLISNHIPRFRGNLSWVVGVLVLLGSAVAAGACATVLVAPLIRRWAIHNASARDASDHF